MKRTVASVALVATLLAAGSASALAPRSKEISLKGIDFNNTADVQRLYGQLKRTARNVCTSPGVVTVAEQKRARECARTTLDGAIAKVDQPMLRMVHSGPAPVQVASRTR